MENNIRRTPGKFLKAASGLVHSRCLWHLTSNSAIFGKYGLTTGSPGIASHIVKISTSCVELWIFGS